MFSKLFQSQLVKTEEKVQKGEKYNKKGFTSILLLPQMLVDTQKLVDFMAKYDTVALLQNKTSLHPSVFRFFYGKSR